MATLLVTVVPTYTMLHNPNTNGYFIFNPCLFSELDKAPGVYSGVVSLINFQPSVSADGSKIFRAIASINFQRRLIRTRYCFNNSVDHASNSLDRSFGVNGIEYGPLVNNNRVLEDNDDTKAHEDQTGSSIENAAKIGLPLDLREDISLVITDIKPYPFSELVNDKDFFLKAICINPRMHPNGQIFEAIAIIKGKRRLLQTFYDDNDKLDRTFGNNGVYIGPEVDDTYALGGFSSLKAAEFSLQISEKARNSSNKREIQ